MSDSVAIAGKARGSLLSRLIVAAITIGSFAALAWADVTGLAGAPPVVWLLPLAVVVAVGGGREAVRLAAAQGDGIASVFVPCAAAVIAVSPVVGVWTHAANPAEPLSVVGATAVACCLAIIAMFAAEIGRYPFGDRPLARLSRSVFASMTLGLSLAFIVALRLLPSPAASGRWSGLIPLVSLIAVVKAGDVAAYVVGSLIGRHRMAPRLSPGKTWEGAAASIVASLCMAWVVIGQFSTPVGPRPLGGWPLFGLLVGSAGMLGDLSESLVKRELNAKDSGASLGGMGGFLDLVDSLLVAAPVAWILWTAG
ncbi:MAG: phosphatidate cytidylyltransferase [Planctomycetia bacterium]|nr:phosphatidate cytidylyltransferase [Planctomycetia bacterium]